MSNPDLDEVRARLAERGLLREESHKVESSVADLDRAARPAPVIPKPQRPKVRPADERDDLGVVTIGCPACAHRQPAPVEETRFRCDGCRIRWVWAICSSCRTLAVVDDDVPSWSCPTCDGSNRSWWHLDERNEAVKVSAERRHLARDREEQRARAGVRRRARKLIGSLAALVVVVLGAVLVVSVSGGPTPEEAAGSICRQFTTLRSEISNGAISKSAMRGMLGDLQEEAKSATADLQSAAALAVDTAGDPGSSQFKQAMTEVEDACAAAGF